MHGRAEVAPRTSHARYLRTHGRPIRYGYLERAYPLRDYQTVYARLDDPLGSAEMASAGRPFTAELLTRLVSAGVTLARVSLHCGVASPEAHEPPLPERFAVPARTADLVDLTRRRGGRVVAVGTTVVRALESAALPDGRVLPAVGWTDLVLGPDRPTRVVDGLVSGLHEPEASHLLLLEAVAGPALVDAAYEVAVAAGYHWHEFGDISVQLRQTLVEGGKPAATSACEVRQVGVGHLPMPDDPVECHGAEGHVIGPEFVTG